MADEAKGDPSTVYRLKALVNIPKDGRRFAEKGETFETNEEGWASDLINARYAENISSEEPPAEEPPQLDVTDAAAELATEHGIKLEDVVGSGEDGRIVKSDVEALIDE